MAKINWGDVDITPDDIEQAEDSYQPYTGEVPPGGVYRFKVRRVKYTEFESGNKGFTILLILDGSWKKEHKKYDGCPLWDRQTMTKGAAGFLKAFARALGVSAQDIMTRSVMNEDEVVTKIGKLVLVNRDGEPTEPLVYVNVKRGTYNDEVRLERAGVGYLVVDDEADDEDDEDEYDDEDLDGEDLDDEAVDDEEADDDEDEDEDDEDDEDDDEDEDDEDDAPPRRPAKKAAAKAAPAKKAAPPTRRAPRNSNEARAASRASAARASARGRRQQADDDEPPF